MRRALSIPLTQTAISFPRRAFGDESAVRAPARACRLKHAECLPGPVPGGSSYHQSEDDMSKRQHRRPSRRPGRDVPGAIAAAVTRWAGSSWGFGLAVLTVVTWAVTGPLFQWSDTWQLVINT